jgi:hypothetical protein
MTRIALALLVVLATAGTGGAQMQCEGRLVETGATTAQVLDLCGDPERRVRSERTLSTGLLDSPGSEEVRVPVEEWTYEEPGQFARKLVFENGRLLKVLSEGYPDLEGGF